MGQDREVQYDDDTYFLSLFIGITIDCEGQDREVQYDDDTYFLSLFIGITKD